MGFCLVQVPTLTDAVEMHSRVLGEKFQFKFDGANFEDFGFMAGVNIGASLPGYDPGELPLTFEDYYRYLGYCIELNINVIRVYTILPPSFYEAVYKLNEAVPSSQRVYVLHGIWSAEEEMNGVDGDGLDMYDSTIVSVQKSYITKVVKGISGVGDTVAYSKEKSGVYNYPIHKYVLGYLMGIEWYPFAVNQTDALNKGKAPFSGKYIKATSNASPFESWLAEMLEFLCSENVRYGWQHPVSFTNWITTDPIFSPLEPRYPDSEEDWITVDPMHITPTSAWQAGYFVNQHAYPYSPDFLLYEYQNFNYTADLFDGLSGIRDPFYLYLARLKLQSSGVPFIVSEVGLPTSVGTSHPSYHGVPDRGHGRIREDVMSQHMEDIIAVTHGLGIQGIMIFELLDEWFKRSWNTIIMDRERKNWHNPMSSEQWFGLVATESMQRITIDGLKNDWDSDDLNPVVFENNPPDEQTLRVGSSFSSPFGKVACYHDETFFYMTVSKRDGSAWSQNDVMHIGFDTVPGKGNYLANHVPFSFERSVDYIMTFSRNENLTVYANRQVDRYMRRYGSWLEGWDRWATPVAEVDERRFEPVTLLTKFPTYVPLGIKNQDDPAPYSYETASDVVLMERGKYVAGFLDRGTNDLKSENFDNRASWEAKDDLLEVRIPWMLLGYSNPASKEVFYTDDYDRNSTTKYVKSSGIHFQMFLEGTFSLETPVYHYNWGEWSGACYCERFKKGVQRIADIYDFTRNNMPGSSVSYSSPATVSDMRDIDFCACSKVIEDPTDHSFVEQSSLSVFNTYLALFALFFLMSQLFYAGFLRPLLSHLLYCYSCAGFTKRNSSKQLQAVAFILFSVFFTVIMVYYSFGDYSNPYIMVKQYIESIAANNDGLSLGYMLYFLSLNWDGFLVLLFIFWVKFPKPNSEVDDAGLSDAELDLTVTTAPLGQTFTDAGSMRSFPASGFNSQSKVFGAPSASLATSPRGSSKPSSTLMSPVGSHRGSMLSRNTSFANSAVDASFVSGINSSNPRYGGRYSSAGDTSFISGRALDRSFVPIDEADESFNMQDYTIARLNQSGHGRADVMNDDPVEHCDENDVSFESVETHTKRRVTAADIAYGDGGIGAGNFLKFGEFEKKNIDGIEQEGSHAFVIACHNSSSKIKKTIEHILTKAEPWQIFVADNGSTVKEVNLTERACMQVSREYSRNHPSYRGPNVNFGTLIEGSKSVAQFATVYNLRNYEKKIDYVTLIDDDTIVPRNWTEEVVVKYFTDDEDVQCLAYPLCSANKRYHPLPLLQNFEYFLAGYMKLVQARLGTALFASGAFSTWRVDTIVDILFRHDTMHHGDDLQQGLILHSLANKPWILHPERKHGTSYKVAVAGDIVVGTDVPVCWVHFQDVVPNFIMRHWKWLRSVEKCNCGEPSLFVQRAKGWDVSRQRFLWKYVKMICRFNAIRHWRAFFARLIALHDAALIINDWVVMLYGLYLIITSENKQFFVLGLLVAWAFHTLIYILFDYFVLSPAGYSVPPEVRVVFPTIYKLPTLMILRFYGMLYNLLYYLPCVRNKKRVNDRFNETVQFKAMVDNVYIENDPEANRKDSYPQNDLDSLAVLRRENVQRELLLARNIYKEIRVRQQQGITFRPDDVVPGELGYGAANAVNVDYDSPSRNDSPFSPSSSRKASIISPSSSRKLSGTLNLSMPDIRTTEKSDEGIVVEHTTGDEDEESIC
eukprot:Nk52_evm48s152 gene=Nk52_evmTU48s152